MKIYLDNIKKIDWLNNQLITNNFGKAFLSCEAPSYFSIFYNYIEETSDIKILSVGKLFNINELVYREQAKARSEYVGFLREPFDTNNFLFYSFLRSICNSDVTLLEKLDDLFLSYKAKDLEKSNIEDKLKIKYSFDIIGRNAYNDTLNNILKYSPDTIDGMQLVSDMIDNAVTKKLGYSFYGEVLKKIVLSIQDVNGGLIPEDDGYMRYMFVGEKYFKNDTLQKAKDLLRAGASLDEIYQNTGWFWNKYDKKWRYRISTQGLSYKAGAITTEQYDGITYQLHIPKNFKKSTAYLIEKLIKISSEKDTTPYVIDLIANGYDAKLSDVIEFNELYNIYPEITNPICFFIQSESKNNKLGDNCFNSNTGLKHIVLTSYGNYSLDKLLSIAAHEIQHSIQKFEGFGNGGNPNFAQLMLSIGGASFRNFFFLLTSFIEVIVKKASLIPLDKWVKLAEDLEVAPDNGKIKVIIKDKEKELDYGRENLIDISKFIKDKAKSPNEINIYSQQIAYNFLTLPKIYPNASKIVIQFIQDNINYSCVELFEDCSAHIQKQIQKSELLKSKGWSDLDIHMLNFRAYLYLAGEFESRYIQATMKTNPELLSYFSPYTSETINPDEVNVYGSVSEQYYGRAVKYGLETTSNNKYILHTKKSGDAPQMILHEYGHIIYDLVKEENITEIEYAYEKDSGLSVEEYFCESFVDYVVRKEIDKKLSEQIKKSRKSRNDFDKYDFIFDSFFIGEQKEFDDKELIKMLYFVNQLIEL
jgi:hypothetical protein